MSHIDDENQLYKSNIEQQKQGIQNRKYSGIDQSISHD